MRYAFIINSKCNPKKLRQLEDSIAMLDDDLRARIDLRYTYYPGHATELATEYSEQHRDKVTIVACGGDGTVHEVVNALAYRSTPMAIIPIGTGNDFARTIYSKQYLKKPCSIITKLDSAKKYAIDLVRVDSYDVLGNHLPMWSEYYANVASVGVDTQVQLQAKNIVRAKDTAFNRKTAYIQAIFKKFKQFAAFPMSYNLEVVGEDVNEVSTGEEFMLISMCNARYYGGGFNPAPSASIRDGVVNVCAVEKVSKLQIIYLLLLYRLGLHEKNPHFRTFKATSGIITCDDSSFQLQGNYDGEDFFGHRMRFEVFPESLNLLTIDD